MRKIVLLTLGICWMINGRSQTSTFLPSCSRFQYFLAVKDETSRRFWPEFGEKELTGPMIFHTLNGEYAIQPNKELAGRIKVLERINCLEKIPIVKISSNVDTVNFNMQVDYDEEDSSLLYYFNPVANISDLPIAGRFVSNLQTLEQWVGMIIHECFHQYQTSFELFRNCQNKTQEVLSRDTLLGMRKNLSWYNESLKNEFENLENALASSEAELTTSCLKQFLLLRDARYRKVKKEFGIEISELEDMLERSEGVARYMELCMKQTIHYLPDYSPLLKQDSLYHYGSYDQYNPAEDPLMNRLGRQYYYDTGLYLARILDKLKIPYKESIYRKNISFKEFLSRSME